MGVLDVGEIRIMSRRNFNEQRQELVGNIQLIFEERWLLRTTVALFSMKQASETALDLRPPA